VEREAFKMWEIYGDGKKKTGVFPFNFFLSFAQFLATFPCRKQEREGNNKKIFFFFLLFLFSLFLTVFLAGPRQFKNVYTHLSSSLGGRGKVLHVSKVLFYAFFPCSLLSKKKMGLRLLKKTGREKIKKIKFF